MQGQRIPAANTPKQPHNIPQKIPHLRGVFLLHGVMKINIR